MSHNFRSASVIEAEAVQKKLDRLRKRWASTRDSWFDGTVASIDARLRWLDEAEGVARTGAARLYATNTGAQAMSLLPQIHEDRRTLLAQRDLMAGDFSGLEKAPTVQRGSFNPALHEAALEFVAEQNTTDREELCVRAARFMGERTASWDQTVSDKVTREFTAAVYDAAPPVRPQPRIASVMQDFDDGLMFS